MTSIKTPTRTSKALYLVSQGATVAQAAKALGISQTVIYQALRTVQVKHVCPLCHSTVRSLRIPPTTTAHQTTTPN